MAVPPPYGTMLLTQHLMAKVAKLLLLHTSWHKNCNERVQKNVNLRLRLPILWSARPLASPLPSLPWPLFGCAMYRNEHHQPEQNEGDLGGRISSRQPRTDPTGASCYYILKSYFKIHSVCNLNEHPKNLITRHPPLSCLIPRAQFTVKYHGTSTGR